MPAKASAGTIASCTAVHPYAYSSAPELKDATVTRPKIRKSLRPWTFACSSGVWVVPSRLVAPIKLKGFIDAQVPVDEAFQFVKQVWVPEDQWVTFGKMVLERHDIDSDIL